MITAFALNNAFTSNASDEDCNMDEDKNDEEINKPDYMDGDYMPEKMISPANSEIEFPSFKL